MEGEISCKLVRLKKINSQVASHVVRKIKYGGFEGFVLKDWRGIRHIPGFEPAHIFSKQNEDYAFFEAFSRPANNIKGTALLTNCHTHSLSLMRLTNDSNWKEFEHDEEDEDDEDEKEIKFEDVLAKTKKDLLKIVRESMNTLNTIYVAQQRQNKRTRDIFEQIVDIATKHVKK